MSTSADHQRYGRWAKLAAPAAAGLLIGAGAVFAVEHHSGSSAAAGSAAAAAVADPSLPSGGGPVAGEQHVQGTIAAKTSTTVTVKSTSGTATYTVNATSEIVRNGRAATLSAIRVGDPVLVHVFPSASGQMLVERLLAGSSASDPGFGPPSSGSGTPGSAATT